jgi:hypothetical protein
LPGRRLNAQMDPPQPAERGRHDKDNAEVADARSHGAGRFVIIFMSRLCQCSGISIVWIVATKCAPEPMS